MDHFKIWLVGSIVEELSYADIVAMETDDDQFYLLVLSSDETKTGMWTLVGQKLSHKCS